jgi:hypothetical protein
VTTFAGLIAILATKSDEGGSGYGSMSFQLRPYQEESIVAVKVWSEVLQEAVWVIADEVPLDAYLRKGKVFTYAEVRVLLEHGRGIKVWAPLDGEMLAYVVFNVTNGARQSGGLITRNISACVNTRPTLSVLKCYLATASPTWTTWNWSSRRDCKPLSK